MKMLLIIKKFLARKNEEQKADIERLKGFCDIYSTEGERAIKEFAEKLKENEIDIDVSYGFGREHYTKAVATIVIDNLVKELTEGQR